MCEACHVVGGMCNVDRSCSGVTLVECCVGSVCLPLPAGMFMLDVVSEMILRHSVI